MWQTCEDANSLPRQNRRLVVARGGRSGADYTGQVVFGSPFLTVYAITNRIGSVWLPFLLPPMKAGLILKTLTFGKDFFRVVIKRRDHRSLKNVADANNWVAMTTGIGSWRVGDEEKARLPNLAYL